MLRAQRLVMVVARAVLVSPLLGGTAYAAQPTDDPPFFCMGGTPGQKCPQQAPAASSKPQAPAPAEPDNDDWQHPATLHDPNGVFPDVTDPMPGVHHAYCSSFPQALGCG
jgi:hypothetical protein